MLKTKEKRMLQKLRAMVKNNKKQMWNANNWQMWCDRMLDNSPKDDPTKATVKKPPQTHLLNTADPVIERPKNGVCWHRRGSIAQVGPVSENACVSNMFAKSRDPRLVRACCGILRVVTLWFFFSLSLSLFFYSIDRVKRFPSEHIANLKMRAFTRVVCM